MGIQVPKLIRKELPSLVRRAMIKRQLAENESAIIKTQIELQVLESKSGFVPDKEHITEREKLLERIVALKNKRAGLLKQKPN